MFPISTYEILEKNDRNYYSNSTHFQLLIVQVKAGKIIVLDFLLDEENLSVFKANCELFGLFLTFKENEEKKIRKNEESKFYTIVFNTDLFQQRNQKDCGINVILYIKFICDTNGVEQLENYDRVMKKLQKKKAQYSEDFIIYFRMFLTYSFLSLK